MMASKVPVKSILRTQNSATKADPVAAQAEKDRQNRNIALRHAHRIQHQKDVQAAILRAIETLIDLPQNGQPSTREAQTFTRLVQTFQPSDLDDLADERRIDGRCGYVLCGKTPRSSHLGAKATWKVQAGEELYCSHVCMRKSLYVKTQLSEIPAWERPPDQQVVIQLHDDDRSLTGTSIEASDAAVTGVGGGQSGAQIEEQLAFERGESAASFKPRQVMTDKIVEKRNVEYRALSSVNQAMISHTAVEGYEPKKKKGAIHRNGDLGQDQESSGSE